MTTGTKSLLFGVRQFLLHPIVVLLGWRRWHGRWPRDAAEWVAILVHDWGYWGCPMMDSGTGAEHPAVSARIAARFFPTNTRLRNKVIRLVQGHSGEYTRAHGLRPSALCIPDKVSVFYEWKWFYMLRAAASGELWEYVARSPIMHPSEWFTWYVKKTRAKFFWPDGSRRRQ